MLVDQGSSANVMFWTTFNKLQLSPDLLRPYTGCLYGFTGDQVEVRGHMEPRTTFTDGTASRMEKIRYLVVNAPSAYNILLGRPTLNRLRAVSSTRHMKMKLPDLGGKVITIKSEALGNGAYRLETLEGGVAPRAWNATNLSSFTSTEQ